MDEREDAQAGRAKSGDQQGVAPGNRLIEKLADAHRSQADRQDQSGAGKQQRHQRIRENHAQYRHRRAGRRNERRTGPEPRGFERWIAAHDVGPDQAQREKIDNEHRPKRRNAQHREPGTRTSRLPCCLTTAQDSSLGPSPTTILVVLPRRLTGQGASAPLNGP